MTNMKQVSYHKTRICNQEANQKQVRRTISIQTEKKVITEHGRGGPQRIQIRTGHGTNR